MEGQPGGGSPQELGGADVSPRIQTFESWARLASAAPLPSELGKSHKIFERIAGLGSSLDSVGRAILWLFMVFPRMEREMEVAMSLRVAILGKCWRATAMHRGLTPRSRSLLPLPLENFARLSLAANAVALDEFCGEHFAGLETEDVWVALSVLAVNSLAGYGRAGGDRKPTKVQATALETLRRTVRRVLPENLRLERSPAEAEKELSSRFLTYTGEEVPKMQVLKMAQAVPALPPENHGGSIDATTLVTPGTRWFLENPGESLLDYPPENVKLQAKVHVEASEAKELFELLVSRRICAWIPDEEVFMMGNQKVLSGMFAVGKGTKTDSGLETQRIIMNLIPCNACFKHAQGGTQDLPSITQYLGMVLQSHEQLVFFQSDMTSAFYLFRIPVAWHRAMAFNISFRGEELGLAPGVVYRPCCAVIPMGWSSAVSVMQEIAERLTQLASSP